MQTASLTLNLRTRLPFEAADLGPRLVQSCAADVWRALLPACAALLALALALYPMASWLPGLVLFFGKPWLDRFLLFVFSRAVFGERTPWSALWAARQAVVWRDLAYTLTLARLSPWRAFTQPVRQLEGLRGAAARARARLLLQRQRRPALGLQWAYAQVEMAFCLALATLPLWLTPRDSGSHGLAGLFAVDGAGFLLSAAYLGVVALVEPYFVASGFALYLNRRVALEAWDVEQEMRRVFNA